jgi:hypothetical protein
MFGTNRLLIVTVACDSGDKDIGSVTVGGQNLTQIQNFQHPSAKPRIAAYYLINPAVGANNVTVTLANGDSDKCAVAGMSFSGVDLSNPVSAVTTSSGSNSSPGISVASQAGDMVVSAMASIASDVPPSIPTDQRYLVEMGGNGNSDHYTTASTREGAPSVGMNWSLKEGKEWVVLGFNINAAP